MVPPLLSDGSAFAPVGGLSAEELLDEELLDELDGLTRAQRRVEARRLRVIAEIDVGRLDVAHLREVHRAVREMPDGLKAQVEATLVEAGRSVRPQDLRGLATLLLDQHRPEVRRGEDAEAFAHRSAFLNTVGDRSHFNVTGDVEGAAVIDAVLRPLMTKRDTEDLRTLPQLRYDALPEALHRLLDSDTLPDAGSGRPHVTLVADIHNMTPDAEGGNDDEAAGAGRSAGRCGSTARVAGR
jgi:hypothetical protein